MNQPSLSLRDGRKLIFRPEPPRRSLKRFLETDIVAAGDATDTGPRSEWSDTGVDYFYDDAEGRRTAIELKVSSHPPARSAVQNSLQQLQRHRTTVRGSFEHAELWLVSKDASKLTIWADDTDAPPIEYGLSEILGTEASDTTSASHRRLNSAHVERRVRAWKSQVEALLSQVAQWSREAGYATDQTDSVLMDEEMMQRFGVQPVYVPVLKILSNRTLIAALQPGGLWTVGGYGRIDILTSTDAAMIVNDSSDPIKPLWVVYAGRHGPAPFERAFFLRFLKDNERA